MARLQIPEDGRKVLWVVVERGDLAVRQSIEIRVLTVHVRPSEPLPLPGQQATIHARVAGEPVDDVRLSAGGEPVGETGLNGSLPAQMPADPTMGVEAQWRGQTATTSFLGAYAPTIATLLMVLVAFVGSPLVGYWIGGKRGVVAVLALWALAGATYATFVVLESVVPTLAGTVVMTAVWLLGTTIVGYWIDGLRGVLAIDVLGLGLAATVITLNRVGSLAGLAVLATTILAEVVVLALAYPNARDELGDGLEGGIRDVAGSLVSTIAWAATNLDAVLNGVVEDLAQFVENLRSMDISGAMESLRALAGRILAGVRRLPGLVASLPGRFRTWMRSPPDVAAGEDSTAHADATRTVDGPPLRKLWRRFARRVAPESWERRTPGELSRRAIDQGYPREPVRTVTHTFRDVEYGDSPLPTGRYREVRRAVDQLVDEEGDER